MQARRAFTRSQWASYLSTTHHQTCRIIGLSLEEGRLSSATELRYFSEIPHSIVPNVRAVPCQVKVARYAVNPDKITHAQRRSLYF
jgi:hypothetical protein